MKKIFSIILLIGLIFTNAYANSGFIVKRIRISGLQGISQTTVLNYLPIRVGDRFDDSKSPQIIQSLFKTGFFNNISLGRSNNTLIIYVKQRPIIGQITVTGNKLIPNKRLQEALRKAGFIEGTIFDNSLFTKIKASLENEYFSVGKYNARINIKVKHEERNRVAISIIISEGKTAKIHSIKIIGNRTFKEKTLVHQFKMSKTNLLSFFYHDDQYSSEKLAADLESLRSLYMDHGYIKFKVVSTQVSITPDRKQIYITVRISEGAQYKIDGFSISGKTILPKQKIANLITLTRGEIFSRKKLTVINKNIGRALGMKGYANADIQAIPKFNERNHTVFLNFIITPGSKIYVRHITFSDNNRTNDNVYRRELRQMEGALLNPADMDESKFHLLNLPFIKNADASITPVPNKTNQVDVNYKVTESSPATIRGGISYSQLDKLGANASISHKNVLGTGNSLDLSLYYSRPSSSLSFTYFNPYYTASGIGRSISAYVTRFDADRANLTDFATDVYGFSMGYSFPMSEHNFLTAGYGVEADKVNLGQPISNEVLAFKNKYGLNFFQGIVNGGWAYSTLNRYMFPTTGVKSNISATTSVPFYHKSLEYYKVNLSTIYFQPLYKQFVMQLRGNIGYGNGYGKYNGTLPFFKNFYGGGIGSVRGYEGNSLGPKDSLLNTLGGKFEFDGTAGLIFPNPLGDSLRTIIFADAGNVYKNIRFNNVRLSAGLEIDWKSPVGVLNFSLAKALNKRKGDNTEPFQFTIGTTI